MFRYVGPEAYEISWLIADATIRILPENTSPKVLRVFDEEQRNAKHCIFMGELLTLSTLLQVGHGSFFWLGERDGIFWRMELFRPIENRFLLRISPVLCGRELGVILTQPMTVLPLLQGCARIERMLLRLDQHGCYRVVSVSGPLGGELGLGEEDDIEKLIQKLVYYQSTALFDISLQTGRTLQITDLLDCDGKVRSLVMTVMPFDHQKRYVALSLYFVDSETFYRIQLHGSGVGLPQAQRGNIGLAFFRKHAQGTLSLEHCNEAFTKLFPKDQGADLIVTLTARLPSEPGCEVCFRYCPCMLENYNCFASQTEEGVLLTIRKDSLERLDTIGEKLTRREREIAVCLYSGNPIRYIANYCGISEGTVKKTASNIYRKLGVKGRVELLQLLTQ